MITVTGEALIDLLIDHDGHITARPGGGPDNTARTIGRLGLPPAFLGRLSNDRSGRMLRARLDQDGVTLGLQQQLTDAPTTLAAADIDPDGMPRYHFYPDGTASAALEYPLALPDDLTAPHAGTLAPVMEPAATSIERLITRDLPPDAFVMIDPNCRPQAITDRQAYPARLARILNRADVVKVSAEDLAYLSQPPTERQNTVICVAAGCPSR
jgi:fructokinase